MNGRLAKRLRRNVRTVTVGRPWDYPLRKTNANGTSARIEHSNVSGYSLYKRAKRERRNDVPH